MFSPMSVDGRMREKTHTIDFPAMPQRLAILFYQRLCHKVANSKGILSPVLISFVGLSRKLTLVDFIQLLTVVTRILYRLQCSGYCELPLQSEIIDLKWALRCIHWALQCTESQTWSTAVHCDSITMHYSVLWLNRKALLCTVTRALLSALWRSRQYWASQCTLIGEPNSALSQTDDMHCCACILSQHFDGML